MSAVIAAMLTAVVGVLGTLFAPLLTYRVTERQRRDEVRAAAAARRYEEARLDHRDRYAEAQFIVPERVLEASKEVNSVLAGADAAVKRLDRGVPRRGETADACLLALKSAEPLLSAMTRLMRRDLGVED